MVMMDLVMWWKWGGGRGSKGNVVSSHECGRGRGGQNDDEDEKK